MVSSNATTDVVIGSTIMTLTCTVELNSVMDVPVTVNVQLSDPASGSPLTTTPPSMSGSTYTFTAIAQIVSLAQSGTYMCTASLNSSSSFLVASSQPQTGTTIIMAVCNNTQVLLLELLFFWLYSLQHLLLLFWSMHF